MKPAAKALFLTPLLFPMAFPWGTPGMRYSLVSREVIADSIETVTGGGRV